MPITTLLKKYVSLFLADGYSEDEASAKLTQIFEDARNALADSKTQADFHRRIRDSTEPDPDKVSPNQPFSLLPGLIECAPFELAIRKRIEQRRHS